MAQVRKAAHIRTVSRERRPGLSASAAFETRVRWTPRFQHLSADERVYSALGGQTRNNLNG
jgi:hypothetical protein